MKSMNSRQFETEQTILDIRVSSEPLLFFWDALSVQNLSKILNPPHEEEEQRPDPSIFSPPTKDVFALTTIRFPSFKIGVQLPKTE
jgi:hypothetical protein